MKINKNKLLDNFKNLKNIANFNLLKCVHILFSEEGLSKNVGFFILNFFILFHIITLFILCLSHFDFLKNNIKDIIFWITKGKKEKEIKNNNNNNTKININNINNNSIKKDNIMINIKNYKKINVREKGKMVIKTKRIKVLKKDLEDFINNNNVINKSSYRDLIILNGNKISYNKNILPEKNSNSKIDKIENIIEIMDYTDDELNDLSYDSALEIDKRSFCQFYVSLLKTKHEIIFAFFYNKDYNLRIIKIDLFFFGFALNYTVNGFFFNDSTMHNVYESKGLFDFEYQLPIIFYSSIISMFIGSLVQMLGLSNDLIIDFNKNQELEDINERGIKLIKKLKIKFVFYFILSFMLLLFFLYYISMFNAVYRNTQFILLEDTLMGFGASLIYPFVIYLFPGFFRIPALSAPQKNKKYLYNFSKLFTIL